MKTTLIALALAILFVGNADAAKRKTPKKAKPVPAFSAKSYIVADAEGHVLKEQDSSTVRPIASISKLMIGILASDQVLSEELEIPKARQVQSRIPTKVSHLTRRELLTLALVKSDNLAAQVLCDNLPNCVDRMNEHARTLEMFDTHFVEPTGLSVDNVSTANDLLKLLMVSVDNPVVASLSSMPNAEIDTGGKPIKINNTNPLTSKFDIILSKTGYTNPAGGCLVMIMDSDAGRRILILLGSKNARTRIPDMEKLVKGL
jgi:D-alanyl-D-alanine endopeptidase (penicillin-binding protein 7)